MKKNGSILEEAFRCLHQTGLGIIDVGARDGLHTAFKEVASLVDAVGFEADFQEWERLSKTTDKTYRSLTYLPFGLAGKDGHGTLHLCRSRGTSSMYKPNRSFLERFPDVDRFGIEASTEIPVRSLDGIVGDGAIRLPKFIDFMKIDTQGSELDVLMGARKTLCSQVVGVEVEVEFARLYESQPLFRDIDAFLSECGFTLFKLRRLEWVRETFHHQPHLTSGQLVFGDALYLRDPLNPEQVWMPQNPHQTEALVLLSMLYDLHDFVLEIVSAPRVSEMLDVDAIRRYVLLRSSRLNRPWKRRARGLANLFRLLLVGGEGHMRRFNGYERGWARGDWNFYSML